MRVATPQQRWRQGHRRRREARRDAREIEDAMRFDWTLRLVRVLRLAWTAKADAFYTWEDIADEL